jgi:hypothetical protein
MSLPGCSSHKNKHIQSAQEKNLPIIAQKKNFDSQEAERQEARLCDIPIPFYQQRLPLYSEDPFSGQVVLGYQTEATVEASRLFFHKNMEHYGWNLRREFKGPELLLEFEKPTKSCAVSIRPRNSFFGKYAGTDLVIYVEDNGFVY